nr:hypothetical protein GCM10020241_02520 [Streptoalloteichus tenebrarius]
MHGEQGIGRLGLRVGQPPVVAGVEVRVVPAEAEQEVAGRGHRHHAGAEGQGGAEPVDQGEVPEMVDRQVGLPPRAEPGLGAGHHARAGDDHVEGLAGVEQAVGEPPDAGQVAQVECARLGARDVADGVLRRVRACAPGR